MSDNSKVVPGVMNNQTSSYKERTAIFTLVLLSALGPASFQIFLPSVPNIIKDLSSTPGVANLTISLSMLSFAFFSLFYGRMADRFENKKLLIIGMLVLIVGSIIGYFSHNIEMVILGRVIQPAGGAAGVVAARAMIMRLYQGEKAAKIMSRLVAAMMTAPLIGVPLGGVLTDNYGWRSNFIFIGVFACVALICVVLMVPTVRNTTEYNANFSLLQSYKKLISNHIFSGNVFQFGLSQSAFMIILATSPIVLTTTFGFTAAESSIVLLICSLSVIAGNLLSGRLPDSVLLAQRLKWGSLLGAIFSFAGLVLTLIAPLSLYVLVIPAMLFCFFFGVTAPVAQTNAIGANRELAGTAAGLCMFISMVLASIATQFAAEVNDGSPHILMGSVACLAVIAFILALKGSKPESLFNK